jgi:predicted RNA binding protein YcfA (HicA-like mRNA interferase family)
MSNLPRISGRDCSKILIKLGKDDPFSQVVVPDHDKLRTGTLRAIIRSIGFSVEEFKKLV